MKPFSRAVAATVAIGILFSACSDAHNNPVTSAVDGTRPLTVRLTPEQRGDAGQSGALRPSYTIDESSTGTAVTLTFEGIGSEVPIGDFYRAQGVVFTAGDALAVGAGLNDYYFPPRSGAAIAYSLTGGAVSFQFTRRATEVGGYVTSYYGMTLTCYNAQGGVVGRSTAPGPNLPNWEESIAPPHTFIRVRGSGIVRCSFTSAANLHSIDDVTFTLENARLQCTPAIVDRGDNVRCAMPVDQAYTIISQRARGQGFTIVEDLGTTHSAGTEYVWEGTAVADTRVQVVLATTEGGTTKQTTHSADFRIRDRDWPKLQLKAPVVHIGIRGSMQAYPSNGVLGNAAPNLPLTTVAVLPVTTPPAGPNVGLSFLTDPLPAIDHLIYLHPALYNLPSTPPTLSQIWHMDQNGRGSGTCTSAVFGTLVSFVERHEGVTQASNSHWGITSRFYLNSNAEQRLERLYRQADAYALRADVFTEFVNLHNTSSHAQQHASFDQAEYPVLWNSIGCNPDNNPNDA